MEFQDLSSDESTDEEEEHDTGLMLQQKLRVKSPQHPRPPLMKQKSGMISVETMSKKRNPKYKKSIKLFSSLGLTLKSPSKRESQHNIEKSSKQNSFIQEKEASFVQMYNDDNSFEGVWESSQVDVDGFLNELSLDKKYTKLALNFAGDVSKILTIVKHDQNTYTMTDSSDRRKITHRVVIGEEFESINEQEEVLIITSRWSDDGEICFEETNQSTDKVVRRKIRVEGNKLYETVEREEGKETVREYDRVLV